MEEKEKPAYQILAAHYPEREALALLQRLVNEAIQDGFELVGGVSVCVLDELAGKGTDKIILATQAIVKRTII